MEFGIFFTWIARKFLTSKSWVVPLFISPLFPRPGTRHLSDVRVHRIISILNMGIRDRGLDLGAETKGDFLNSSAITLIGLQYRGLFPSMLTASVMAANVTKVSKSRIDICHHSKCPSSVQGLSKTGKFLLRFLMMCYLLALAKVFLVGITEKSNYSRLWCSDVIYIHSISPSYSYERFKSNTNY
jgi:hypothetical protein